LDKILKNSCCKTGHCVVTQPHFVIAGEAEAKEWIATFEYKFAMTESKRLNFSLTF